MFRHDGGNNNSPGCWLKAKVARVATKWGDGYTGFLYALPSIVAVTLTPYSIPPGHNAVDLKQAHLSDNLSFRPNIMGYNFVADSKWVSGYDIPSGSGCQLTWKQCAAQCSYDPKAAGFVYQDRALGNTNCCFLKSTIPSVGGTTGELVPPSPGQTSVIYAKKPLISCQCGYVDGWNHVWAQVTALAEDYPNGCNLVLDPDNGASDARHGRCLWRTDCKECKDY